jgi:hypothetical protein
MIHIEHSEDDRFIISEPGQLPMLVANWSVKLINSNEVGLTASLRISRSSFSISSFFENFILKSIQKNLNLLKHQKTTR